MAASDVVICNLALSHIGADANLSSINPPDGSVESGYCQRYYPVARQELLENPWSFAKTRKALSALSSNPSTVWAYAYAEPSDLLKPLRVLSLSAWQNWLSPPNAFYTPGADWPYVGGLLTTGEETIFTERGSAQFDREGGVLLTNEPDAVLLYLRDVTDTSKFTPGFTVTLSYLVAAYLAGALIKGSTGATVANQMRDMAGKKMREASALDANGSTDSTEFVPEAIRARA